MDYLHKFVFNDEFFPGGKDWGLLILRLVPTLYMFFHHGLDKNTSGAKTWV